jgi:Zn-dependent peptidase ImmA (M78 family)/DNA-binding XRE family transcriptional regulator
LYNILGGRKRRLKMNIGRRLEEARHAIGYTLEKASEESGIGKSSISEFENSKREPKFSQLSKLAEVYRRTIEFFLTEERPVEEVMLWREQPDREEEKKKYEAEFHQLCQRYHKLEMLTGEAKRIELPQPNVNKPEEFDFGKAELFAKQVQDSFRLGAIPIASLKQILEEIYFIKIFYLDFTGSAISIVSEEFGQAILLNAKNKQWRRSYDLAHELFHILSWDIFRKESEETNETEEKLANTFASRLLMPEEPIKDMIISNTNDKGQISFNQLDDIARKLDVSLEAIIYRVASIYRFKKEKTAKYIESAQKYLEGSKPRPSYKPNKLPERYCDLAQRALREGKLSLMQFAKYMGLSYKKAQDYIIEDEDFKDEKISISVA